MNGIEILYKLVLKNNKLNEISLLKDNKDIKYELIERKIKKILLKKIKSLIISSILEGIQKIHKNKLSQENTVYDFINSLLKK